MSVWPAFVGPAYQSQSPIAAIDRCVNLYPESLENAGEVKAQSALYPTPGLSRFASVVQNRITQCFSINGRAFFIAGTAFYEVQSNGATTIRGFVLPGTRRPSMACNGSAGNQIFITSGGQGYIFNTATNVFSNIIDPNFPTNRAVCGFYLDGYFVVQVEGTTQFQLSTLNDGLTWSGLLVAQRSFGQDIIAALGVTHRQLVILGQQTSEVWYNSGATFPLQPITGVFLEQGCGAPDSVANLGETLLWVSESANGARSVVLMGEGYQPQRVSTHAIEYWLGQYASVAGLVGYPYEDQGHKFYILTAEDRTFAYDLTTGLWHERGYWNPVVGEYQAQRAISHMYAFGKHLVGDRIDGTLWDQSIAYPEDGTAGQMIRRMRTGIHLSDELRYTYYGALQIDLESGLGTPSGQGVDPLVQLRYSDNGGQTWSNQRTVSAGRLGQYGRRARFRQLGRGRDRVFEITMTDPIPWRMVNAYLEITPGAN